MEKSSWRSEVARLLEHCASSLRAKSDHQALVSFGTAVAYLAKAHHGGSVAAGELLSQFNEVMGGDGSTQRFTFAPGELEELKSRPINE
ncbi:MAG: hypothetical protein QM756_21335 [Polyangiaceae bacterium]